MFRTRGQRHRNLSPGEKAERHGGADQLAHLHLRSGGAPHVEHIDSARRLAREIGDPAQVDPRRWRRVEVERSVHRWVEDRRRLTRAIDRREISANSSRDRSRRRCICNSGCAHSSPGSWYAKTVTLAFREMRSRSVTAGVKSAAVQKTGVLSCTGGVCV